MKWNESNIWWTGLSHPFLVRYVIDSRMKMKIKMKNEMDLIIKQQFIQKKRIKLFKILSKENPIEIALAKTFRKEFKDRLEKCVYRLEPLEILIQRIRIWFIILNPNISSLFRLAQCSSIRRIIIRDVWNGTKTDMKMCVDF